MIDNAPLNVCVFYLSYNEEGFIPYSGAYDLL
jgi:hypothetical protein